MAKEPEIKRDDRSSRIAKRLNMSDDETAPLRDIKPASDGISLLDVALALFPYIMLVTLAIPVYLTWWQMKSPSSAPSIPASRANAETQQATQRPAKDNITNVRHDLQTILDRLDALEKDESALDPQSKGTWESPSPSSPRGPNPTRGGIQPMSSHSTGLPN